MKPFSASELAERLAAAVDIARGAGEMLVEGLGHAGQVRTKRSATDLLTEFDLKAEGYILDQLRGRFPGEAILAEELGRQGEGDSLWVVDPLDGTTNFAHGIPFYCVSMAWVAGGQPRVGVIYAPALAELFTGVHGGPAKRNSETLQVSDRDDLDASLLVTGFPYDVRTRPDNNLDNYRRLALRSRAVRRMGSAALDLAYVAAGRFDGYWEVETHPWDFAAGALLVECAGGRLTTLGGDRPLATHSTSVVATNGRIHDQLLTALSSAEAS